MTFSEQWQTDVAQVETALEGYLSGGVCEDCGRLAEAVRYSALAGGKRLRPVLMLAFCRMAGGDTAQALPFACALEMIHNYSLIHDDLPCMDNDDLRRGRPTNHKVFGDALAVLAGDALLTRAFETASQAVSGLPPAIALRCVHLLAQAAGMDGMVGGQTLDMEAEHQRLSLDELKRLQALKTGCLIRAACETGCLAAGRDDAALLSAARTYGDKLGLAFQIRDDMLDVEGDPAALGKSVGQDEKSGKSTFPALLGMERCRALVRQLTEEAAAALAPIENHDFLTALAYHLSEREN